MEVKNMKNFVVALLTDYGTKDTYVAEVKAAILKHSTNVVFVDISHEIHPYDILEGAFLLMHAAKTFPPNTIFIAVVDPTVGTEREATVIFTKTGKIFIGPDNGLMFPAAEKEEITDIFKILVEKIPDVSATFHGRDVFAFIAGHIVAGKDFSTYVEAKKKLAQLSIPKPNILHNSAEAVVLHVDRFGNAITNVKGSLPPEWREIDVMIKGIHISRVRKVRTYGEASVGETVIVVGGTGYTELAINQGNAAQRYGIAPGDRIVFLKSHP
ncbi:MAG: SAM-dependent chlorinase/fluorinase [Candidatus Caldarchaeum sp.]|uniref:SAM-dependent chlorinase/fluorinase n=1 Tax=Caldiarchaeum subterraneum TaxID=311458 RepID=A0A7C5YAQ0_CALS0